MPQKTHREILYSDKKLPVLILSANLAEKYLGDTPYILISIHNPSDKPIKLNYDQNCVSTLVLSFADAENGSFGGAKFENVFTDDQANQIADFIIKYINQIKLLVVNCQAGMSRSAGAGAAISKVINGEDQLFFDYYRPNSTVRSKVYRALMEKTND